jgi:hypothetical protein
MWWVGAEGAGRPVQLLGPEPKLLGQPVSGRGLGGGATVRRDGDRAREPLRSSENIEEFIATFG